jgi:hypothetical protein
MLSPTATTPVQTRSPERAVAAASTAARTTTHSDLGNSSGADAFEAEFAKAHSGSSNGGEAEGRLTTQTEVGGPFGRHDRASGSADGSQDGSSSERRRD